jgi:uncharacterized protein (DUF1810 family)
MSFSILCFKKLYRWSETEQEKHFAHRRCHVIEHNVVKEAKNYLNARTLGQKWKECGNTQAKTAHQACRDHM